MLEKLLVYRVFHINFCSRWDLSVTKSNGADIENWIHRTMKTFLHQFLCSLKKGDGVCGLNHIYWKISESLCMGDTDSVMIQSYYGNHSLLGKGRLLGSKVSTIFLYILPQTLKSNSPLRLKALTFHSFVDPWLLTIHLRMEKRSNFSFTVLCLSMLSNLIIVCFVYHHN